MLPTRLSAAQRNADTRKGYELRYIVAAWLLIQLVIAPGFIQVAGAQDEQFGFDDGIVGDPLLVYEWKSEERPGIDITVRIGSESRRTGYSAHQLLMGENGVIVRGSYREMFFPSAGFSFVEITDFKGIKLEAFESFISTAIWHHDLKCPEHIRLNFWYTFGETTHGVCAHDVIVTPRFLAVVVDGGYRMKIIDFSQVRKLEILPATIEITGEEV